MTAPPNVQHELLRDLRMVSQHVEICGPDPIVRAALDRLQDALAAPEIARRVGGEAVAILDGCSVADHPCRTTRWLVDNMKLPPGTKLYAAAPPAPSEVPHD
ncbi:hypothetical protein [Lysobacter sp. HA35]